jgi:D-alanine-D-alanine ligase
VTKRLFKEAGFLVLKSRTAFDFEASTLDYDEIVRDLGELLFVKPCNLGSSVGISKVRTKNEFKKAIDVAFQFDQKILIETAASTNKPREIELAVLGDHESIDVSVAGEIVPNQDFYTYSAKYLDENGADLIVPAKLSEPLLKNLQDLAKHAFRTLCCYGMARVDFFLTEDNTIYLNEINSIPGFTKISMYPKLWEASGIPYSKLIERLIELSMSRFEKQRRLKIS